MSEAEEGKVCSILSYFLVGIIWYFADEKMKKNAFAKFHAKQGLALLIVCVAVSIVGSVLGWLPIIGGFMRVIMLLLSLCLFVLWVLGIINSAQGKSKALPVIGSLGESLKI